MKKWRYLFSFTTILVLCFIVGLGLFLYCDSDQNEGLKERKLETVTIRVVDEKIVVEPTTLFVNHNDRIIWKLHEDETNVPTFTIYFGYNTPIGDDSGKMYTKLRSGEANPTVAKKVWHNPLYAGGRHTKYFVAVYYQTDSTNIGKVLIKDPDIIIPRRGGN